MLRMLFAGLALAALVVLQRRAVGATSESLPAGILAALGVCLALAALAFRRAVRGPEDSPHRGRIALAAAPSVVAALFAVGLLVPGTSVTAWLCFLGVLLVEEGWSWGRMFPPRRDRETTRGKTAPSGGQAPPINVEREERLGVQVLLDDLQADGGESVDESATQWMVRRNDPEAGEIVEGWVKCAFERGQRHAIAHLAICPPLAAAPVCYAEASDGPACQVKVAQVLPYGVRLEIKLDQAAEEPCEVQVEFSIQERGSAPGSAGGSV